MPDLPEQFEIAHQIFAKQVKLLDTVTILDHQTGDRIPAKIVGLLQELGTDIRVGLWCQSLLVGHKLVIENRTIPVNFDRKTHRFSFEVNINA